MGFAYGRGAVEVAQLRFGPVVAITGLQNAKETSYHLITRQDSQMYLLWLLGKWPWDWTKGFFRNDAIITNLNSIYIGLNPSATAFCIDKLPGGYHRILSSYLVRKNMFAQPLCCWRRVFWRYYRGFTV